MNKETKIFIFSGIALAVLVALLLPKKTVKKDGVNKLTGKVKEDIPLLYFNGKDIVPMGTFLNAGDQITIHAEENGLYKIDCDGIYCEKSGIELDSEYANFLGNESDDYDKTGIR
ncbi:MAG: hypothetical protein ACTSXG_00575 [Alphaproteobacteria bacterium]